MSAQEKERVGTLGAKVCSKTAGAGQWAALAVAVLALAPAACSRHAGQPAQASSARPTPSGQPVPRYISLKFDKVNARAGPGDDYPLKWVYQAKGLPLQVVAETDEWRRVCDAYGSVSWVHRRTTDARRTVLRIQSQDLTLQAKPEAASAQTATLVGHAIADLKICKDGWCRLAVGHVQGWAQADQVWGTDDAPQCRGG